MYVNDLSRRSGRGIRRILARTFLAAMVLGWLAVVTGGRAAAGPASAATLTADQAAEQSTTGPGAPTGLNATAGDAQVTLSWTPPASDGGASIIGYYIYEATTPNSDFSTVVPNSDITGYTATATAGSATVTALVNGTTYYFWVTAVNDFNTQGPMSGQASATPAAAVTAPGAPTLLTAEAGNGQVSLSWTAPASDGGADVTGYDVYDGTTGDFTASTMATTSTSTSATVTGLANGTTYDFWVTAVNTAGQSSASNEATARPDTATHVPPSSGVPGQLIAVLAAAAVVAVAGALTLVMRGRRRNIRSPRHVTPASQVRAEPGLRPPDSVIIRETGSEPTHTVRFEPDQGTTTTTIKEKP
jgi:Fibronectin type III domain